MPRGPQSKDEWGIHVMDSIHATIEDVGDGLGWAFSQVGPIVQGALDAPKAAVQGVTMGVQALPLPGHEVHKPALDERDRQFGRVTDPDGTPIDSDSNDPDNWAWDSMKNLKRGDPTHEVTSLYQKEPTCEVTSFYRKAEPEDPSGDPRAWNWDSVPQELLSTPASTPNLTTKS